MARKHKTKIAQPSQYPQQCPQQIEMVTEDQLVARLGTHRHTDTQHRTTVVQMILSCEMLASFPGRRRNGLATSASSNCYFRCLKVGSTNQVSDRSHMTTVKPNCIMHWTVAVAWWSLSERLLFHFSSRTDSKQLLPRAGKPHSHSWENCKYHVH